LLQNEENMSENKSVRGASIFVFLQTENLYKFKINTMIRKVTILGFILFAFVSLRAQDTLLTTDNTKLVGEIKSMDRGVLVMETDFSDDDFTITWLKVQKISSQRNFRIILSNDERLYGTILYENGKLTIQDEEKGAESVEVSDIVYMKQVDEGSVFDLINLALDVGYSYTNANNLQQLNGSLTADYTRNKWGVDLYATTVKSIQTGVDNVMRNTAGFGLKVFANYGFYGDLGADYYSNTEQSMDLRSNYNLSLGKYIFRTNRQYLSASIGAAFLNENYSDTLVDRNSYEGKVGVEYNMFDMGDLNVFTSINLYPSFTEKGRLRTEYKLDVKLDLPRDFYIKGSLHYNYDNMPAEGVTFDDYVYTFGIGWEL